MLHPTKGCLPEDAGFYCSSHIGEQVVFQLLELRPAIALSNVHEIPMVMIYIVQECEQGRLTPDDDDGDGIIQETLSQHTCQCRKSRPLSLFFSTHPLLLEMMMMMI